MRIALILLTLLASLSNVPAYSASGPVIPNFWDPQEKFIRPNVKSTPRLRFLTTTDFPPFSYVDSEKRLSGFHVDLARAICTELELPKVCQIQALPFDQLKEALETGRGEAILAGISVVPQTVRDFEFSRPYFRIPARFVASKSAGLGEPLIDRLAGADVGVVDQTAHAAFAQAHFGAMKVRVFASLDDALAAMQKGEVKAVFGDGLNLAYWLQGKTAAECCSFVGDPYLSERYFGQGLTIAVRKGNLELSDAIDYALRSINDKGIFAELYLRYFPISLF